MSQMSRPVNANPFIVECVCGRREGDDPPDPPRMTDPVSLVMRLLWIQIALSGLNLLAILCLLFK